MSWEATDFFIPALNKRVWVPLSSLIFQPLARFPDHISLSLLHILLFFLSFSPSRTSLVGNIAEEGSVCFTEFLV
jgi:hypothetical protein